MAEFFYEMARGNSEFKLRTRSGFQVGARIVVPPFPFSFTSPSGT